MQNEVAYVVAIHAGSTGSTLFIYKISLNRNVNVVTVSRIELLQNSLGEVKPALSSLTTQKCEVSSYLEKFVEEAKKIVPESSWLSTPILFLAKKGTDKAVMDKVSNSPAFLIPHELATPV